MSGLVGLASTSRQQLDELLRICISRAEDVRLLRKTLSVDHDPDQNPTRMMLEVEFREEWRRGREEGSMRTLQSDSALCSPMPTAATGAVDATEQRAVAWMTAGAVRCHLRHMGLLQPNQPEQQQQQEEPREQQRARPRTNGKRGKGRGRGIRVRGGAQVGGMLPSFKQPHPPPYTSSASPVSPASESEQQRSELRYERLRLEMLAAALEEVGRGSDMAANTQSLCDLMLGFMGSSRHHLEMTRAAVSEVQKDGVYDAKRTEKVQRLEELEGVMQQQLQRLEAEQEMRKQQAQHQGNDTGDNWRQQQWRQRQQICQMREASVRVQQVVRGFAARQDFGPKRRVVRAAVIIQRWWKWGKAPPPLLGKRTEIAHLPPVQRYQRQKAKKEGSGKSSVKGEVGKTGSKNGSKTGTKLHKNNSKILEWGPQGVRRWQCLRSDLWYRRERGRCVRQRAAARVISHFYRTHVSTMREASYSRMMKLSTADTAGGANTHTEQVQEQEQEQVQDSYESEKEVRAMWARQRDRMCGARGLAVNR